ncbi:MAG: VWA domain-containing protein [Deltaproteobacteria bacterium]|nr:VWA domain-containing protein [Deltaproteobacteria bacterium]
MHRSTAGDFSLALPANWSAAPLSLLADDRVKAASRVDGPQQLRGMIAVLPDETGTDKLSPMELTQWVITTFIDGLAANYRVEDLRGGSAVVSHDGHPTVIGAGFTISPTTDRGSTTRLRDRLLGALVGRVVELPPGPERQVARWRLRLAVQRRVSTHRLVVLAAIADEALVLDDSQPIGIALDGLTDASALAEVNARLQSACELLKLAGRPTADILWIVDGSASMWEERQAVATLAQHIYGRVSRAGLDFRMGVVPMTADPQAMGRLCSDKDEDRFLGPDERQAFEGCISRVPGAHRELEYGLQNAMQAMLKHLPRRSQDDRHLRSGASTVMIVVTDERAQTLADLMIKDPGLAELVNCPLDGAWRSAVRRIFADYIDLFSGRSHEGEGKATLHLIGPLCSSGCTDDVAHAYSEVSQASGGLQTSICDASLKGGLDRIFDDVIQKSEPAKLSREPINLSLGAGLFGERVERSRERGFDYHRASRGVLMIRIPYRRGDQLLVSYQRWRGRLFVD